MSYISENLKQVNANIKSALEACGRKPEDARLIAVTKYNRQGGAYTLGRQLCPCKRDKPAG